MNAMIENSIRYLESDEAMSSLESNLYWPKWDSPWWHMTLLHEMGLASRIPKPIVRKFVDVLKASPLKIFPIHAHDNPEGLNLTLSSHCHCSLGNIYQALSAAGVDLDEEAPWMREWFLRYQLPDGGLNCDGDAYLKESPPSSMVGTISPLEAVLFHTSRAFTAEEEQFLDRGAKCLLERKLMLATTNPHNPDEKGDEEDWMKLCFPRFYLYDVLRGLNFVLKWADRRGKKIPESAIRDVVRSLEERFPDGQVRLGRHSYEGISTITKVGLWDWKNREPGSRFLLLEQVSGVGDVSATLSQQWMELRSLIVDLRRRGLI